MGFYKPGSSKPIPLSEFAPDANFLEPGILLDAVNAQPTLSGFSPLANLVGLAPALSGRPQGTYYAYYSNETATLFAAVDNGSGLDWFVLGANVWVPVTGPTVNPTVPVRFSQFGDDVLTVGNFASPDGVWIAPNKASNFVTIPGSPPNATVIVVAGLQAVVFVGANWFSSAAGDVTDWTLSLATRADTGILADTPGPVVAASPLFRNIIAFKKNITYLGTQSFPEAWSWEIISTETGTWSQGCVIQLPDGVAFLGMDDFYLTTGYTPQRIPNKVKQWFFRNVDPNYIADTLGWYDEPNSILYWHFVSREAPNAPTCDRYVSYNIRAKRWCVGRLDVSSVPYLGIAATSIPNPGVPSITFSGDFIAKAFSTFPANMVLTTGYYGDPGRLSQLMRILPLYNRYPCDQTCTPLCTDVLGQPDKQSENAVLEVDGWFYTRQYERYHKLIMSMNGDCEITGIVPELRPGGLWGYGTPGPCITSQVDVESQFNPTNDQGEGILPQFTVDGVVEGGGEAVVTFSAASAPEFSVDLVCNDTTERGQQAISVALAFDQLTPSNNPRTSWGAILNGELRSLVGSAGCGGGNMNYFDFSGTQSLPPSCSVQYQYLNDNSVLAGALPLVGQNSSLPAINARLGTSDQFSWMFGTSGFWQVAYVTDNVRVSYPHQSHIAPGGSNPWAARDTEFWIFSYGNDGKRHLTRYNRLAGTQIADYTPWGTDAVNIANMNLTASQLICIVGNSTTGTTSIAKLDRTTGTIASNIDITGTSGAYLYSVTDSLIYFICNGVNKGSMYYHNGTDLIYVGKTTGTAVSAFSGTGYFNNGTFYFGGNGVGGFGVNVMKVVIPCPGPSGPVVASISVGASSVPAGSSISTTFGDILLPDSTDRIQLVQAPAAGMLGFVGPTSNFISTGSAASGTLSFPIPALAPAGNYILQLVTDSGLIFIANSGVFAVT